MNSFTNNNSDSPQFEPGFHIQTCANLFVGAAGIKSLVCQAGILNVVVTLMKILVGSFCM